MFFGAHNLGNPYEAGRILLSPKKIIVHDEWNHMTRSFDADVSLLQFEEGSIPFNEYIQPICLLGSEINPNVTQGIVIGWGKSEDATKIHENMPKMIQAPIQPNDQCFLDEADLIDISSLRTFCAGLKNGSGICQGDSGGGLFIKMNNVYFLYGIVSSSLIKDGGCDVSKNAVYTDVLKFTDWIKEKTKNAVVFSTQGKLIKNNENFKKYDIFHPALSKFKTIQRPKMSLRHHQITHFTFLFCHQQKWEVSAEATYVDNWR